MFTDPEAVARYAEGAARQVPGLRDLHRMAAILLAERAGADANLLILGAGGGLELRAFADLQPGWRFTGIDPSAEMLAAAGPVIGPHAGRVTLKQGYVADAPPGPFDGAACLLVLHFLPEAERLHTLTALRQRLRPGAALVVAHHSFPQGAEQARWLDRYAAFAVQSGVAPDKARAGAQAIADRLPLLSPAEDEALLHRAGFTGIAQFYGALTFRGWVAYAA